MTYKEEYEDFKSIGVIETYFPELSGNWEEDKQDFTWWCKKRDMWLESVINENEE